MWSVQFIQFFGCRKNKRGCTETYTHIQKGSSFSFVSVTPSYFYSSSGFGNSKTQESGSRFKGLSPPVGFAECYTQVLPQSRTLFCFFSHTHRTILTPLLCHLNYNRTINRSGATHVRTIFCVYMGLSVCNRYWDGYFGCVTVLFVS